MTALPLTGHALHKAEMEYHGKFVHTLGWIQHIALMRIIYICYTNCCLDAQPVAPNIPGLQDLKRCIKYLASNPHKLIFYPYNSYDGSNFIRLTCSGDQVEDYTTQNYSE